MNAMKKILAFALAGVMALALLTGCGTGSSASHKSIAKAMADYDNSLHRKTTIYLYLLCRAGCQAARAGKETRI